MKKLLLIVLANQSLLLRQLMSRSFEQFSDLQVVAEVTNSQMLPILLERLQPDWLFVSLDERGQLPVECDSIVVAHPNTSIIALSANGDDLRVRLSTKKDESALPAASDQKTNHSEYSLSNISLQMLVSILRGCSLNTRQYHGRSLN